MSKYRYVFQTKLEGFVNCGEPSGRYNSCGFKFRFDKETQAQADKDREELMAWVNSKATGRVGENPHKQLRETD